MKKHRREILQTLRILGYASIPLILGQIISDALKSQLWSLIPLGICVMGLFGLLLVELSGDSESEP